MPDTTEPTEGAQTLPTTDHVNLDGANIVDGDIDEQTASNEPTAIEHPALRIPRIQDVIHYLEHFETSGDFGLVRQAEIMLREVINDSTR